MGLVERDDGGRSSAPVADAALTGSILPERAIAFSPQADAPSCPDCGALMVRNGACYKCLNCGATSGCS